MDGDRRVGRRDRGGARARARELTQVGLPGASARRRWRALTIAYAAPMSLRARVIVPALLAVAVIVASVLMAGGLGIQLAAAPASSGDGTSHAVGSSGGPGGGAGGPA